MQRAQDIRWEKRAIFLGMVLGLIAFVSSPGEAGIAGTAHDFSGQAWSGGEICVVCHAPHNNAAQVADSPLWNHDITSSTFTVYSSSTLNSTVQQPGGVSKLCLSCHDGSVALDSFGGDAGRTTLDNVGANLGIDLSNDHPISFTYNAALATADGELVAPANLTLPLFGANNDQLECATCHDVHNDSLGRFLRASNAGSALCLTCHTK